MVDEKNNSFDPTSLDAWKEHNTFTIMFSDKLGFTCKNIDVLQWMNEQKGNPLLASLQESMKQGENPLANPDEDTIDTFTKFINDLLIELVVSPPLTEQGNKPEESYSLRNVSFAHKVMVFEEWSISLIATVLPTVPIAISSGRLLDISAPTGVVAQSEPHWKYLLLSTTKVVLEEPPPFACVR